MAMCGNADVRSRCSCAMGITVAKAFPDTMNNGRHVAGFQDAGPIAEKRFGWLGATARSESPYFLTEVVSKQVMD